MFIKLLFIFQDVLVVWCPGMYAWCCTGVDSLEYDEDLDPRHSSDMRANQQQDEQGQPQNKLKYEQLAPLVLDAEDTAWRRGDVDNFRQHYTTSPPDGSSGDTVGSIVLR